jgi:type I restriction enzyme S subunit
VIAAVLGALDDKIECNRMLGRLLEDQLGALFARGGLDKTGENIVKLDELLELNPQRPKPSSTVAPYVDMAALPTDSALVSAPSARPPKSGTRFTNGDTVMARITPCLENGKTAYIDCLADAEVGIGSTEFIVLRPKNDLPTQFAYFLAKSDRLRDFAVRHMSGSSGRQRCSAEALARYELAQPEPAGLRRFAEQADISFMRMRSALNESLVLAELRDVLLPRLLSGDLRVHDGERLAGESM